ncbi:uncharacterized protein [Montipora foliosa]|uniref:uncharacterized protein n=1 Tax=Montipora foliosa TaxID=591990 RepID=UPI0035F17485
MDRVSNAEVLHRTQCDSMHTILTKHRLRWFGHVCRMPQNRLPKKFLFSEVISGHRAIGRPLLRFQDRIRDDLRHCGIREDGVEKRCAEKAEWRKKVYEGAAAAEKQWQD